MNNPEDWKLKLKISEEDFAAIESPNWETEYGKVHNWRNYIDDEIKRMWDCLSLETRFVAYRTALRQANEENWDD